MVNELLSTSLSDTCEFYYRDVTGNLLGRTFNAVEIALLGTGVTPVGILRRSQAMADMAISGYQGANRVELNLNPEAELVLDKEDTLVLISYDEKEVTKAFASIAPGKFAGQKPIAIRQHVGQRLPFSKLVIINWNPPMIRDILTEMAKICANLGSGGNRLEVILLNSHTESDADMQEMNRSISGAIGQPLEGLLSVKCVHMGESLGLKTLEEAGVTRECARNTRVLILSEGGANQDSDLQTLHQLQIIENRVSEDIFTAMELIDSRSQNYFRNTRADVVVSIDSFAEHLMAQAVLKPYISLIFRNLLTFSDDTCEFYFRDVPDPYLGRSYAELQKALVGHPIILIGHARPMNQKGLHPRYTVTLNPKASGQYDDSGRGPRVLRSEKLKKGDRVVLVARVPEVVDSVLQQIS